MQPLVGSSARALNSRKAVTRYEHDFTAVYMVYTPFVNLMMYTLPCPMSHDPEGSAWITSFFQPTQTLQPETNNEDCRFAPKATDRLSAKSPPAPCCAFRRENIG